MTGDSEITPMAFVNGAIEFHVAVDELLAVRSSIKDGYRRLDPVYFLCGHALELALKGYLRLLGLTTAELSKPPYGHNLTALHHASVALFSGLNEDQRLSVQNVIELLNDSNRLQGLRYYTAKNRTLPEPEWAARVVRKVVGMARDAVLKESPTSSIPGPAVKIDLILGEPRPND